MLFIKIITKSIKKQKKKTLLMTLQLFITFVVITVSLGIYSFYHQAEYNLKELITNTNSVARFDVENTDYFNKLKYDKQNEYYNNLFSEIKKNKNVSALGSSTIIYNSNNDASGEMHGTIANPISIVVDKEMLKIINVKIIKGRNLKVEDFDTKQNLIPVLLCGKLADKYKLNTVLDRKTIFPNDHYQKENSKKFIVVGIINSDFKYWTSDLYFVNSIENGAIIPVQPEDKMLQAELQDSNYVIKFKDSNAINEFNKEYDESSMENSKYKNIFSKLEERSFSTQIKQLYDEKKDIIFYLTSYSVILTILGVFGLIGVILSTLEKRKKEFGIKIALGANPLDIVEEIVGEIIIMFITATSLGTGMGFGLSKIISHYVNIYDFALTINLNTVTNSFLICLALIVITSILPIFYILKTKPIKLIREV